ncbi:hypothetical protein HH310_34930 [Actinoplanes sp. TBRC 11911]|uniref:hypothetical protein n=1 Tax=Actinoplanes sp. TBRC 11911 TaxID=2729386 RepID=UPI00145E1133|nr:hypothetical protein [Actinoplanes sp. TBRC 11911]NMO56359.1 hypothetical protein [Actinoplanes sp. TBRC 11911]
MAKHRRWPWVAGVIVLVAVAGAVAVVFIRDPLLLPGRHDVEVFAVNDEISSEVDKPPGWFGRTLGLCDADTRYAELDGRHLCLVLSGPLGTVRAARRDGKITLGADQVTKLRRLAARDTGTPRATTRLVLMAAKPAALIPVTDLATGSPMSVAAL